MLIVAIAWIYVVGMASIAEALSPQGSVLGAVFTFVLYGVVPLSVVLYLIATPARKKALRQAEAAAAAAAGGAPADASSALPVARADGCADERACDRTNDRAGLQPDGGGHAAGGAGRVAPAVAPVREEP